MTDTAIPQNGILDAATLARYRNEAAALGTASEQLLNCLDSISTEGTPTVFERVTSHPNPYLTLAFTGETVGLPLPKHDAQKIIAASHQAPFGRGTETSVDKAVRNTWELNHDQFAVSEAWQKHVLNLTCKAYKGLGIDGEAGQNIKPELYKLLLYEPGAMFKPHTDTEKAKGMLATLVVSLPSIHTGGTVVLSHNGNR